MNCPPIGEQEVAGRQLKNIAKYCLRPKWRPEPKDLFDDSRTKLRPHTTVRENGFNFRSEQQTVAADLRVEQGPHAEPVTREE